MAGSFAESLVKELDAPDVTAIIPVGSQARGDATQHSDWDLTCLTTVPPKDGSRNRLLLRDGRLVTAATTAVATMRAEPSKPESAIWVVPALRQARILLDKDRSASRLIQDAESFTWQSLEAADDYCSGEMAGFAEEVHKVVGGLGRRDESTDHYAVQCLVLGMARVLAVHGRLFIHSENTYLTQVQQAAGARSAWRGWFRLAAGLDIPRDSRRAYQSRGVASLRLYSATVKLLEVREPDRPFVDRARRLAGLALRRVGA